MSARAAWRLDSLGFIQVFRYAAGKADWLAHGLPTERKLADLPRAGDLARRGVITCFLTEGIDDVRQRARATGWNECVVVNEERVVLGLLRKEALGSDSQATIEELMESGPLTFRPNRSLEQTVQTLRKQEMNEVLITTPDGELIGIVFRTDAERRMDNFQAASKGRS